MSNEKYPGCLGYIGDEILRSCLGIITNRSRNPILTKQDSREMVLFVLFGSWRVSSGGEVGKNEPKVVFLKNIYQGIPAQTHQQKTRGSSTYSWKKTGLLTMVLQLTRKRVR